MKTRIKIIERKNGTTVYMPQVRKDNVLIAIIANLITIPILQCVNSIYWNIDENGRISWLYPDVHDNMQSAQKCIDLFLKSKDIELGKKMKEISYIKYP